MSRIQVKDNYFVKDGRPFFYQGDTLWMAFSKLSLPEWKEIMRMRREERFTVAQISVLPITHDNAPDESDLQPFPVKNGRYDFDQISDAYFDHAEKLLAETVRQGLVPCLHLLWVDYVPGTWGARLNPECAMTWEQTEKYLRYAILRFEQYEPIYSLTGDTKFENDEVIGHYRKALRLLRELAPEALVTMHLTSHADPPAEFDLDFYSYQQGHVEEEFDNAFIFAEQFLARRDGKPIVNTEPPYEGHGYGRRYGRYTAFDIRRALWTSLLSGASAGTGYGAHGVWMMYRHGQPFSGMAFSDKPFLLQTALAFPGALEGGFAQHLYECFGCFGMKPFDCLNGMPDQIRAAKTADGVILIYSPYCRDIKTNIPFSDYIYDAFNMQDKSYLKPEVTSDERGMAILAMPEYNADTLFILRKKR